MSSPKIIVCGTCAIDITFPADATTLPLQANVSAAGTLLNTAILLGIDGHDVTMVGEVARDTLGDILLQHLQDNGVNITSIDRFSDGGTTPIQLRHTSGGDIVDYGRYPDQKFDTVWPRIDPDDIVVFGSGFALDPRVRPQLIELLDNATQRNATIIYVPDIASSLTRGVTRLMPAILENLETSHVVFTHKSDIAGIFGAEDARQCYRDKINFYCPTAVNCDTANGNLVLMHPGGYSSKKISGISTDTVSTQAALLAGFISSMARLGLTRRDITGLYNTTADELITRTLSAVTNH